MAKQMTFTDDFGDVYPASYWRVVEANICKENQRGRVVFYGFKDEANKGKRIIGIKAYEVNAELYGEFFAPSELSPEGSNPFEAAYRLAVSVKDIDLGEENGRISFFENAADV